MTVAASTVLALVVFALATLIQSRILLDPMDRLPSLGRKLRRLSYVLAALAISLLAAGLVVSGLSDSYVSVGVTLLIVAVSLFVESQILIRPTSKLSIGRQLRQSAFFSVIAASVLLVVILVIILIRAVI